MTPKGTFAINGAERVIVSQLVRSPRAYFSSPAKDKKAGKDLFFFFTGNTESRCLAEI